MKKPTRQERAFWNRIFASFLTMTCKICRHKCYPGSPYMPKFRMKWGVISNAHGTVYGWQFIFECHACRCILRFDEDEVMINAQVAATTATMHS